MNFLMALFVGLATVVCGVFASVPLARDINWTNTTTTTTAITTITTTAFVGSITPSDNETVTVTVVPITSTSPGSVPGTPSGSLTTASKTTSAEPTVYTIPSNYTVPGNGSVEPIHWHLTSLQAFADKATETAHYAFQVVIQPNVDTMVCDEATHSSHGKLDGFDNAECRAPAGLPPKDVSIPVTFHFGWRSKVHNNLGQRGDLLIIKSNSPGSAHACPNPPYDACWAQGLYWISERDIRPTVSGHRYMGPETVHLNGTYCRTGMPECVWSEYLY